MPVLEPCWSDSPRDRFEIFPADRNIDVFREPSCVRLRFLDIQVGGQATNDPVLQPRGAKGLVYPVNQTQQIIRLSG